MTRSNPNSTRRRRIPRPVTVWDSGLQPERTALAWRRSALTLLTVSLAVTKLTEPTLGLVVGAVAIVAVTAAGFILFETDRRYKQTHQQLTTPDLPDTPDGVLGLVMVAIVVLLGVLALADTLSL